MHCLPPCPPRRLVQIDLIICGWSNLVHLELLLLLCCALLQSRFPAPPQNQINPQVEIQQRREGHDASQNQATVLKDGREDWLLAEHRKRDSVKMESEIKLGLGKSNCVPCLA